VRGLIEGLDSPHPLGLALPAAFADDDFAQRFVSGLDEVLAPVFATLDSLDAYLDPDLAPADFLEWIASWLGLELNEHWPLERRRELVGSIVELYGRTGTVGALRELVAIYAGEEPEISDSGAAAWSAVPGGDIPGDPVPRLTVRVRGPHVDEKRVRALVAAGTPAHVIADVEVLDG
jgi:phage tail-like protein